MNKLMDVIFICSSVIFNISVSALYIATKLGDMLLVGVSGGIVISLIVPFAITLLGYMRKKAEKKDDNIARAYSLLSLSGIVSGLYP
jgi:hypothetical protein